MNNSENKLVGMLILAILLLAGAAVGAFVTLGLTAHDKAGFGAPTDQVTLDNTADFGTAGSAYAGPQADTVIVSTSTGRVYFEISNISTSSIGQILYCNTNDRPATIGKGIPVYASSTRIFTNLIGAIRCRYAAASSGVVYFEK